MASASQQRLKRTRIPEQMALDLNIPAALDLDDPDAAVREQGEFILLANGIAAAQPHTPDPWRDSPFAWFKRLPPARRGTTGQALLSRWLTHCGVDHAPRHGEGEHDLLVETPSGSRRVQVRVSTQWSEGDFVFQGVRPGQYDVLALLGIAPHHVYLWAVPQQRALAEADASGWVAVPAGRTPAWLAEHGGSLTTGTRALRR